MEDDREKREVSQERNGFFHRLVDRSPEPMAIHSEGIIRYVNEEAIKLMEADSASELVGKPILSAIHPDDHKFAMERVKRALETGEDLELAEERFITLKGNLRYVELASTHTDWDGKPGLHILARDITEKKKSQEELTRLADIVKESNDAILTIDLNNCIVTWNPAAEKLFGWTEKEVVGKNYREFAVPENLKEEFDSIVDKIKVGKNVENHPTQRLHKNGTTIHVSVTDSGIKRGNGKVVTISAIIHDVTEQGRREAEVARLAYIVKSSRDAIITADLDGLVLHWNDAANELFSGHLEEADGFVHGNPIGKRLEEVFLEDSVREYFLLSKDKILQDEYVPVYTVKRTVNNKVLDLSLGISGVRDDTGKTVAISAIIRDITELKIAQEKMALLAAIVEDADDAIISKDLQGTIITWNSAAERMYGYLEEEIVGKNISTLFPPDHLAELGLILQQLKNGVKIYPFDTVRVRKNGKPIDVSVSISPVTVNGEVVGGAAIARDITQRKLYEEWAFKNIDTKGVKNS